MADLTANSNPPPGLQAVQSQLGQCNGMDQPLLTQIEQLYDQGRYTDALSLSVPLGPLASWCGPDGRILAGRLAGNLGAPRLGRTLHWLAGRENPEHPSAQYYAALAYWSRFGTLHAWRRYQPYELPEMATNSVKADWLALKATMLGAMRDFARAEPLMIEALELDSDSAWLHVQLSDLLDRQDLHEDALMAAREALKLRPFYRPGVQTAAHRLVQLRKDDEALMLLTEAATRLQSGEVWCQLAALQRELKNYQAAWESLERAQQLWPLADADGQHQKWLMGERCDLACLLERYDEALAFAQQIDRPFYQQLVQRLTKALADKQASRPAPRVQLSVPFVRQFHDACVPATLTAIANYWQKPVQQQEIAQRICYEGTRAYDERRWADENGFHAREFRVTEANVEALIRVGVPMTLTTVDPGYAHSQGIVGFDAYRGTFLIQDPNDRHVAEAASEKFLEHYASTGPRGMLLVPVQEASRIDTIELDDATLYDEHYAVDRALAGFDRAGAGEAIVRMQALGANHRLTLQCQLSLARYDSDPTIQLELVEKLLQQFPTDTNLLMMKLSLLSEFGQRTQRIEILKTACTSEKTHPILWSRLAAELLDDARDHQDAYYQLRRALRYNPNDARALSLLGDYFWARSERSQALELFRLAASVNEKDEDQSQRYFMAARYLHQTEEALGWLRDRCRRFNQRSSSPGRTLTSALESIDHAQEAQAALEETVRNHPEDGELLAYAALYSGRYHQMDQAAEYMAACEGKCSPLVIKGTSAMLALYAGNPNQARDLFREVVQLDPLDIAAHQRIVQLELDLSGVDAAEQHLRSAVARFPHSYSLRTALIQFLRNYKLGDVEAELNAFFEVHPHDAWARREAAIAAMGYHNLDRASQEAQLALQLDPNNENAHCIVGRIHEQRGELSAARQAYRRAIELNVDCDLAIGNLIGTCDRPTERHTELSFIFEQLRKQTTYGDGVVAYRDAANGRMEPHKLLEQLNEARTNRPDLWQTWSVLIHQHLEMNQRAAAVELAKAGTERFPMVPRMWLDLAMAHRQADDHDAELAALERARAINPHWVDVARALSELYMSRDQYDEAEKVIRQVLAIDPRDPVSLGSLADCLYRAGKKPEALQSLVSACVTAPGFEWGWARLCDWSAELDQGQTAQDTAQKTIAARPHDARSYLRQAETLHEIEQIPQAFAALEQALGLDERFVDAHVLKAFYLGRLHRWDEALEACNPACFATDIPAALRIRRAFVLYRKGLATEALAEMQGALERDADHYGAWGQLADWAQELNRRDVYRQAAENMVRLEPHQPVPRGYLADALLDDEQGRPEAKQHLRTALECSPEYAYGTMRLFELYLEDKEYPEAHQVLELAGDGLPPGYLAAFKSQLAAVEDLKLEPPGNTASELIMHWLSQDIPDNAPLARAIDALDSRLGFQLITQLKNLISSETFKKSPIKPAIGWTLGRLASRLFEQKEWLDLLKSIPEGDCWHECVRSYMRSMPLFRREYKLLESMIQKYRSRLKKQTATWSATANTLFDYGWNSEVVKWTRDWRSYPDLVTKDLIPVVATRWELYQFREARKAMEHGLKLTEDSTTSLLRVWAGLDALLLRKFELALEQARNVVVTDLHGWYQIGYRLLVSTLESLPSANADASPNREAVKQLIAQLQPSKFLVDTPFATDQLSKWLARQMAARIAEAYGHRFTAWKHRLMAFSYTIK